MHFRFNSDKNFERQIYAERRGGLTELADSHTCTHQNGKAASRGNGDAAVADLHQPVLHNTEFSTDVNTLFCSVKPGNTQLLYSI